MSTTIAVKNSFNAKLGVGWSVTYRPVGPTCPPCGMSEKCYAKRGRVAIHQRRAKAKRLSIGKTIAQLDGAPRVRWEVSGDNFRKDGTVDSAYLGAKYAWHDRNPDSISLGYTHGAEQLDAAGFGPASHPPKFHLLASCEGIGRARKLRKNGWRTARVVKTKDAPRDKCEVLCPVDEMKHDGKEVTTDCAKCKLCWGSQHLKKSIVFLEF